MALCSLDVAEEIAFNLDLSSVKLATGSSEGRHLVDSIESPDEAGIMLEKVIGEINADADQPIFIKLDLARTKAGVIGDRDKCPVRKTLESELLLKPVINQVRRRFCEYRLSNRACFLIFAVGE